MAKVNYSNCQIIVSDKGEIQRVQFIVNNRLFFRDVMPKDSKVDVHTWLYDKIFEHCPLSWADLCKVKITESAIPYY